MLSDAGRNPPCTLRSTSIAASRDDRRVPNYRPRPNRASLDEERPRRSGRTTETSEGGAADRLLPCRLWIDRVDRRARPLRSRQGDSDKGGGRRTSAGMDSKSIRACRSTQRPSRRQNGPSPAASEAQREKTNAGDRGICLYSLVAVGLPHHHGVGVGGLAGGDHGGLVEDGGDGGDSGHFVCSCGYAGTSAALRAFVLFPGYAEVDLHTRLRSSWKLETALGKT